MRFTVTPEGGVPLVLHDEELAQRVGWWLSKDGVHGWFGTPAPREQPVAGVARDSDLWPATITQGARVVTLDGLASCRSTLEAAIARDRLSGLAGKRLELLGEDAAGQRSATGYLSADPDPRLVARESAVAFALVITCPDPLKYGPEAAYPVAGGSAALVNGGTAPSWPRVRVEGPVTRLALSLGGQQVRWAGDAASLDLDLADMEPSAGAVTVDNAFAVPPGTHEVRVSTDGSATLYLRSAWR